MDRKTVTVKSYANIAIIKYWGKLDAKKMIPATSSISLTLENMYTETKLSLLENAKSDLFFIDNQEQSVDELKKASKVLDLFREDKNQFVKIETWNNMPTAAGLSSSSSGLSALVKAANQFFNKNLATRELAQIAKFASGSSSRSFYGPIAAWDKDSGDIFRVNTNLKMAMIMLVLTDQKKPISSREGMKLASETSTYFPKWVKESEVDYQNMLDYLAEDDFSAVGTLTEKNALAMHQTNKESKPAFNYLTQETYQAMDKIRELRQKGYECYFTMDAGPNVKVLCLERDLDKIAKLLENDYHIIKSKTVEL
ncbi:diphosphomevalonate decarboxylase [Streptococcus urinalis FB127-CNA-2]|uniref:diphosphomevalonate decarboxylase n=1 Tax=Streptococcus urinalis 2285-97 TaxID=764291 RepID=G5KFG1_9STRE|nr:diphosphomevalonate decarboxylase [Streptococcus urinalis]EHJ56890.1 diphosphomevalonate decarboxylase [Streptococcus urinalis 2285-97]EKS22062.1 diphosphomevalonate decarboxylase [Streptococcus urinalis FB127-CNA-2]VEF31874.1 mevalonate diphosphate decarboxylase [Streptococcus urinalis]